MVRLFEPKKKKRSPRRKWSPQEESVRIQNNYLKNLEKRNPALFDSIMLRRMIQPQLALGAGEPQGDDLREKLIELALKNLENSGPAMIQQNLQILQTLLQFSEVLPTRDKEGGMMGILQELVKAGPGYLAALKNAATPGAVDQAQLAALLAAQQGLPERPVEVLPRKDEPAAPQPALPGFESTPETPAGAIRESRLPPPSASADPVADLVARVAPLLDRPPAEAAEELVAILGELQDSGHPFWPIIAGLFERPLNELAPLLWFAKAHPVYGPLASRLLEPAGQAWLREVRAKLEELMSEEEEGEPSP